MDAILSGKYDTDRLAIVITQTDANRNPRSTVGTLSDIYTDLRMIYEKLGMRTCLIAGVRSARPTAGRDQERRN